MDTHAIAAVCHEANRAWCFSHGDFSQKEWSAADNWQPCYDRILITRTHSWALRRHEPIFLYSKGYAFSKNASPPPRTIS
jgi:hypothetical protein